MQIPQDVKVVKTTVFLYNVVRLKRKQVKDLREAVAVTHTLCRHDIDAEKIFTLTCRRKAGTTH